MASRGPSRRDDRFDFLRGIALLVIFIDHVPKNLFESFTLHSYAFCDAAEVFFFISGYVAALVYGRVMLKNGFVAATRKVWRRSGVIYGAQMLLMAAVLSVVWVILHTTGNEAFRGIFRVQWIYENPLAYLLPTLTMHYQPGYLDILPAYVVLMALFPLVLWGMNRNVWLVFIPSFLIWLLVQTTGLALWTTNGEKWFFNPFAWQFLFVIGACFGHPAMAGRHSYLNSPWLLRAAFLFAIPVLVIQFCDMLTQYLPWMWSYWPNTPMLDKPALGALRVISFLSLAVIVRRYLPASGTLTENRWALPIIRCGRYSLQVFSMGALLSGLTIVSMVLLYENRLVQSLEAIVGVVATLLYGAYRDKCRQEAAKAREQAMSASGVEPVALATRSEVAPPRA